jgi:hypothetical protein
MKKPQQTEASMVYMCALTSPMRWPFLLNLSPFLPYEKNLTPVEALNKLNEIKRFIGLKK